MRQTFDNNTLLIDLISEPAEAAWVVELATSAGLTDLHVTKSPSDGHSGMAVRIDLPQRTWAEGGVVSLLKVISAIGGRTPEQMIQTWNNDLGADFNRVAERNRPEAA